MYSSGTVISTFIIGSNITALACLHPSLNAIDAAILNAISDESTSWYEPSTNVALKSITGYPAKIPLSAASLIPCSIGLIYSFGTAPPTILLSNSIPFPGSNGSISNQTSPYCPLPDVHAVSTFPGPCVRCLRCRASLSGLARRSHRCRDPSY